MKRKKTKHPGIYRQSNGRYLATIRVAGEQLWDTFPTIRDAKDWRSGIQTDQRRGSFVHPDGGKILFDDYSSTVFGSWSHLRPSTTANIESRLKKHILPRFGRLPLEAIGPADVREWIAVMVRSGLAPTTVKATYRTFAKIMKTAESHRLLLRTPCMGIDLPKDSSSTEMLFINPDEIRRLAESIPPRYSALVYTAAYTGARFGELAALKVGRLHLDRGTIDIVESLSEIKGRLHLGPTKTGKRRTLTLPLFLIEMVRHQMAVYPSTEGFVFCATRGGALRHHNFYRRHYKPAVLRAGLNPKLRFHDLRHSCAALLIAQGAHVKEIQEHLGHSSSRLTIDRYGHLFPHLAQRLREGLEHAFQKSRSNESRLDVPEGVQGSLRRRRKARLDQ